MKYPLPAILLVLACTGSLADETRYVRDSLTVVLRAEPQGDAQTVSSLPSGTAVTLLETRGAMARVRTGDGKEGWLADRYLLDEPIARDRLKEANAEIERLRKLNNSSESGRMLAALEAENSSLRSQLAEAETAVQQSGSLEQSNLELSEQNSALRQETEAARAELAQLAQSRDMEYFRNGALAVGAGALLTILIPWLRPKRRRSEWA